MIKWLNIELNKNDADRLKDYLYTNKIYFETSGCYNLVHFEIKYTNEIDIEKTNKFLELL